MKLTKKITMIVLSLLLMISITIAVAINVSAETVSSGTCGDDLTWTLDDEGTLTVSGTGKMSSYSMSKENAAPWYPSRTSIKKAVIENGIENIGVYAFNECSSLTEVVFPDSVKSIDIAAFNKCTGLKIITIGNGVTDICRYAFSDCSSLTDIIVPDSVVTIGENAFLNTAYYDDTRNWDDGVLYICNYVIKAKTSLSGTYSINADTKSIADCAFKNCENLSGVEIPDGVINIGGSAFCGCKLISNIVIPDSVKSIGDTAFEQCFALENVYISDNSQLETIGIQAFEYCENLKSITIPKYVTSVGSYNFLYCNNLTEIYWNAINCDSLSFNQVFFRAGEKTGSEGVTVTFGDSVEKIPAGIFLNDNSTYTSHIKNVKIGKNVKEIGGSAFYGCINLTSITIPQNVTHIGSYAFSKCNSLSEINWNASNCEDFSSSSYIFEYAGIKSSGISVVFSDSVSRIPANIFNDFPNTSNIKSVSIGKNVTSIGECAFRYHLHMTDVYYDGTSLDRSKIEIGNENDYLENATWHYNCSIQGDSTEENVTHIIIGNPANGNKTYSYRSTVTYSVDVPAGGTAAWYINDQLVGTGDTFTTEQMTNNYTIRVVVTETDGTETTDTENVTIRSSFLDRLFAFILLLFDENIYTYIQK